MVETNFKDDLKKLINDISSEKGKNIFLNSTNEVFEPLHIPDNNRRGSSESQIALYTTQRQTRGKNFGFDFQIKNSEDAYERIVID
jgi:hypothetical protein